MHKRSKDAVSLSFALACLSITVNESCSRRVFFVSVVREFCSG